MNVKNQMVERHQTVARLVEARRGNRTRAKIPDVAARLRRVYEKTVISDRDTRNLWAENRGEF